MVFNKKKRWHCLPGQPLTELDKKVMYWENKGKEVPSRDLILTEEQIEGIRRAGVVNTGVLDEVARQIHAGMNTQEIDDICMAYCEAHGAIPACLNYEGFPKSVCTSINEVVCHGIPKEEDVLEEGDIINVDFTTILDGYYADASRMFIIGKTTPEKEQLVRVAKECLEVGMEAAKPYCFVGDIGNAIQKHAHKYGYGVVRDLCGHGVGLSSIPSPMCCIMAVRVLACCSFRVWCSPLNRWLIWAHGRSSWMKMIHTDGKSSHGTRSPAPSGSIRL